MSDTFRQICQLVKDDNIRVSRHAFRRMSQQNIGSDELVKSIDRAILIEDYPSYFAGPSVLVLHFGEDNEPIHAVWGIAQGTDNPAVLITTYRPDPNLWSSDFRTRK